MMLLDSVSYRSLYFQTLDEEHELRFKTKHATSQLNWIQCSLGGIQLARLIYFDATVRKS